MNDGSSFVVAIDGPAASGKGTLARKIAEHMNLPHFDTGLSYRGVGHALLEANLPLDDENLAVQVAENLDLSKLDKDILSAHDIGNAASKIAVMSRVRTVLVDAQRRFATTQPGAVMDGRDIGTVVCPDAQIKFYVTAGPEIRAKRRYDEIIGNGKSANFDEIFADIVKRDERDMERKDSPLRPAADAHLLDTSKMSIENAFQTAIDLVKQVKAA